MENVYNPKWNHDGYSREMPERSMSNRKKIDRDSREITGKPRISRKMANGYSHEITGKPENVGEVLRDTPRRPRHIWAWVYGSLLTAYTVFTLLQVFVIPHDTIKVDQSQMAEIYQSAEQNLAESATGSLSGNATMENLPDTVSDASDSIISFAEEEAVDIPVNGDSNDGSSVIEPGIVETENGYIYQDANMCITLSSSYVYDTMVYTADIQLNSVAYLKSGLASDSFGRNVTEATSSMAERLNAILAINGDFYGFRDAGYVIRNGVLYRSTSKSDSAEDLVLWPDGTLEVIREGDVSAEELLELGALQVYSFGPGLVEDGEITVGKNEEVGQAKTSNPRTAIGMISPLHYVMVVSDGRSTESEGLSLYQLAGIMKDLGCTEAYNLDGGGSTTMYFNGEVINNPTSGGKRTKERSVSDIVYIGY